MELRTDIASCSNRPPCTTGGGENLERPIFRNFKITNINIMKDEIFDGFIFEFISFNFNKLLQQFDNFLNFTILIFQMVTLYFFYF